MKTKRHVAFAAAVVISGLAMPGTSLAQAEFAEPEPTPEVCPCACEWECCNGPGVCDIFDFLVFQNAFVLGDPCAIDKDTTTGNGVGDIFDFLVFQHEFINRMFGNC